MKNNKFKILVEWVSPEGARGDELRSTWAHLRIFVGDTPITRVEDIVAGATREGVYLPVLSLAEWMTANWWCLLYEPERQSRLSHGAYFRRHMLSAAGEGFGLPSLRIESMGEYTSLRWSPSDRPEARIRFLSEGRDRVPRSEFEQEMREFIEKVVRRLESNGIENSSLSEEWNAINSIDEDEYEFCRLVGILGSDPYCLPDDHSRTIMEAATSLSMPVAEELFAVSESTKLAEWVNGLNSIFGRGRKERVQEIGGPFERIRRSDRANGIPPWEEGYRLAAELRAELGLGVRPIQDVDGLSSLLWDAPNPWFDTLNEAQISISPYDAVVCTTEGGGPYVFLKPHHIRSRSFWLCRALCEHLLGGVDSRSLVTSAHTDRQKRNRAFAAEFLAPHSLLSSRMPSQAISEDQLLDLADEFGTSDWVVRHQIQNHGLGEIVSPSI